MTFKDSAGTVVRAIHYDYDGFDRKMARKVGTASAEYYVYDGDDVVLDFLDGDGTGGGGAATLQERYLFGPAVDRILAQENVTLSTGPVDCPPVCQGV